MKILSINSGSSSLKFKMYEMPEEKVLIYGYMEKIGGDSSYKIITDRVMEYHKKLKTHGDAVKVLIDALFENNIIKDLSEVKGIGHRIVNGAGHYMPELITDEVIERLESISDLSKVHMKGHIAGIKAFRELGTDIPGYVLYDTAFHHTMPEENYLFPVPYEWYEKYGVRRFGFHGISCKYITKEMEKEFGRKVNIIICHIGNGASVTAVKDSQSIYNSMGFTANAGLIMGTRSGDIDYSLLPYVSKKTGLDLDEIDHILNYKSGLEGFVEGASDNRDLVKAIKEGNHKAKVISEMCENKVVDYIARYYVMLDDIDAIIFTAGVGENAINFRRNVLLKLHKLGITVNKEINKKITKFSEISRGIISGEDSTIPCYVIPTDEEVMIARDTYEIIEKK